MDNYILDVQKTTPSVRTALVLAPMIYGKGEGPIKQSSIQLPSLARVTLNRGHVVRAGPGKNYWGNVHIADVGRLFAQLAEQAEKGVQDNLWGNSGIYLASMHEMVSANVHLTLV
jgi:nucleoside-diphosphate-sugar epimerase